MDMQNEGSQLPEEERHEQRRPMGHWIILILLMVIAAVLIGFALFGSSSPGEIMAPGPLPTPVDPDPRGLPL